jgi:magnesium transporter
MDVLTAMDRDRLADLLRRDEFFWLDLTSPDAGELRRLEELFHLHPIAIESVGHFPERPKLDKYDAYVVLVFYGIQEEAGKGLVPVEVHLIVSGSYVVTVHRGACGALDGLRDSFARGLEGSEEYVVFKILDVLADSFFPALAAVDEEIDALEDTVVSHADERELQRIFKLKRELVGLRRIVTPQRDLLARAIDEIADLPGLVAGRRDHFRDVYDHMIRVSDLIDSYRDLLTGALDVYLSTVSNRLNVVMERLTIVATIFLPLSVLTGFFGMNFAWMVRHVDTFAAFALLGVGGVVVSSVVLLVLFRRAGYLGDRVARG